MTPCYRKLAITWPELIEIFGNVKVIIFRENIKVIEITKGEEFFKFMENFLCS